MNRTRLDRKNDFDEFYRTSLATFSEFRDNDSHAEKFEKIYTLNICPGSRAGKTNNRVVEVFWGSRAFENISLGRGWTTLTEYGATLLFQRDDSGFVLITLSPANTDNRKPFESSITLKIRIDPKKLKDKHFLKSCWDDFMAYMECTSLDGNPSLLQKIKVSNLRTFKHLIIDNKWNPTKFSEYVKEIAKFVFSVGLSGFIIVFVTLYKQNENEKSIEQEKIKTQVQIETINTRLESIINFQPELKYISKVTDSIDVKTTNILKMVEFRLINKK